MNINKSRLLIKMLRCRSIKVSELSPNEVDENYLSYLCDQGMVGLGQGTLYVIDPIRLAMEAMRLGVDVEVVSQWLNWRDFEELCVEALRGHHFNVKAPFRFKVHRKRYEVDIVAHKKNVLLCIDCKHWRMKRGQQYKIKDSAINHLGKCAKLAELVTSLKSLELKLHSGAYLVPVIVTLMDLNLKNPVDGVWVLPIFKLNSFLLDLESHVDELSPIKIC